MPLYLNTHVLIWLYQDSATSLTTRGSAAIENANELLISPIVELELTYLQEINRITVAPAIIIDNLRHYIGLEICKLPFISVVGAALSQNWTRDPFDRLIVAQAAFNQSALLTADRNIQQHYNLAFW